MEFTSKEFTNRKTNKSSQAGFTSKDFTSIGSQAAANSLDSGIESVTRVDILNCINFVWGPRAGIIIRFSVILPKI